MIQTFRKFFSSKIGIGATLAFLVLIAIAFASSDLANSGFGGGQVSGADRVAVAGNQKISAADLQTGANTALQQMRQQDPRMSMEAFIARGGLDDTLNQMMERAALVEFGRDIGLRASDRLIDSELLQIPAFRGVDGKFSRDAFLAVIGQQGLSEANVRSDIATTLIARQLAAPVMLAPVVPRNLGQTYASLLRETRRGSIALIPGSAFAPETGPTDAQLQAYYSEKRNDYIRPERRVIRYATFGEDAIKALPQPTDAQIAERYQRDRVQYAATERRDFTQVVVPTQTAAQQISTQVNAGASLDAAARERGLSTSKVEGVTKAELTSSASAAVAESAFAAASGKLAASARSRLGWTVMRVDKIDRQAERPLAQVRGEITEILSAELRRTAFSDMASRIEGELNEGAGLADIAKRMGLTLQATKPVTADGNVYGVTGERVSSTLAPAVHVAFDMEEGEPQLAEVVPGQTFALFEVTEITPSAPAPLAEIREDVLAMWKRDRGSEAAKLAADRILDRVKKGANLADAVKAEKATLPVPTPVDIAREELARQGANVPPPLALMFSMAQGSTKRLEDRGGNGWYVVRLEEIKADKLENNDPLIDATLRQLGSVTGEEYAAQFVAAVRRQVKTERNEQAVSALKAQLAGTTAN